MAKQKKHPKKYLEKSATTKAVNKVKVNQKAYEIDASGKVLGRLATEVANILRGKNKPDFYPNRLVGDKVIVTNASKIIVTGKKMKNKIYYHHTGYLGHLKSKTMEEIFKKNPSEILRRAVNGMLPKNKLRKYWMKNLNIYNNEEK